MEKPKGIPEHTLDEWLKESGELLGDKAMPVNGSSIETPDSSLQHQNQYVTRYLGSASLNSAVFPHRITAA